MEFILNKLVPVKDNPIKSYRLHLEIEHGDADARTENETL